MKLLVPRFPICRLPIMLRIAVYGAVISGGYGIVHDQISYSISPEYFTKMKFRQFAWANLGWPPRVFASEVGFLGTWWVGLFAGWFIARAGVEEIPAVSRRKCIIRSFAIVFIFTVLSGAVGCVLGIVVTHVSALDTWRDAQWALDLEDLRSFVIVAYLHAAGYLGSLVGLVLAIWYVRNVIRRSRSDGRRTVAGSSPSESAA